MDYEQILNDYKSRISGNLKRIRLKQNITQEELAEKVGCNKHAISSIECKSTFPQGETIAKICGSLNIDIQELFIPISEDKSELETLKNIISQMNDSQLESLYKILKHINSQLN